MKRLIWGVGTVLLAARFVACSSSVEVPQGTAGAASGGESGDTHAGGSGLSGGGENPSGASGGVAGAAPTGEAGLPVQGGTAGTGDVPSTAGGTAGRPASGGQTNIAGHAGGGAGGTAGRAASGGQTNAAGHAEGAAGGTAGRAATGGQANVAGHAGGEIGGTAGRAASGGQTSIAGHAGGGAGGTHCVLYYPEGIDPDDEGAMFEAYTHEPLESFCERGSWCPATLADAREPACSEWDPPGWYINFNCDRQTVGYYTGTTVTGFIFDDEDQLIGAYVLDDISSPPCDVWNRYGGVLPHPCVDAVLGPWASSPGGAGGWEPFCTSSGQGGGSAGQGGNSAGQAGDFP